MLLITLPESAKTFFGRARATQTSPCENEKASAARHRTEGVVYNALSTRAELKASHPLSLSLDQTLHYDI